MLARVFVTWLHSRAVTGSTFLAITPWPRVASFPGARLGLEVSGKSISSFVRGELSFLKLGSDLVGLSGGVSNFVLKANIAKLLF